jgi:hypothetical protein
MPTVYQELLRRVKIEKEEHQSVKKSSILKNMVKGSLWYSYFSDYSFSIP